MPKEVVFKPQQPYSSQADSHKEREKEFTQTWMEWCSKNKVVVWDAKATAVAGIATVYTVPIGKLLYITNLWATVISTSAVIGTESGVGVFLSRGGFNRLLAVYSGKQWGEGFGEISFACPIILHGGESIRFDLLPDGSCSVGFVGILDDIIV